jgi:iron complex outermembrane receptor protein
VLSLRGCLKKQAEIIPLGPDPGNTGEGKKQRENSIYSAGVTFRKFLVFACFIAAFADRGLCQSTIGGRVTDEYGAPVAGADVVLENTYQGGVTDANGFYSIKNTKTGTYILTVSHVGYNSKSEIINVSSDKEVNFKLSEANIIAEEVVILSGRVKQGTPLNYTNVSKSEIKENNFGEDIPYILGLTPSMVYSSDAGTGIGYTNFRIRGTDMNRINVTVNGVPLNDAESHGVWWVDLPDFASSIDNVQIQRGVGTSVTGSAGFGATMNFQTSTLNRQPYASVNSIFGSYNTLKNTISAGTGMINNRFSLDFRMSGVRSDGYIDRASSDLNSFHLQAGYYTGKTMIKLNVLSGREETYQAWYGVPSLLLKTNRRFNPAGMIISGQGDTTWYDNETDNYKQDHYQLAFSREFSRDLFLNATVHYTKGAGYYEEYRQDQILSDYTIEPVIAGNDTITSTDLVRRKWLDNDFYGLTWSLLFRKEKLNGSLGGGVNRYNGRHFGRVIWARYAGSSEIDHEWYRGTGLKTDGNIFIKVNYQVMNGMIAYGDIQYRLISYEIGGIHEDLRKLSVDKIYSFFNPKLGLNYDFNSNHSIYFAFAAANREPNRSNFTDADTAHPAPEFETLFDYELGYKAGLNKFYLEASLYYMNYRNQLILTGEINNVGAPVMTNIPKSYRAGVELIAGYHPWNKLKIDANLTISRNRIKKFTEYVDNWDYWNDPENQPYQFHRYLGETDLAFSPSLTGGSRVTYEIINDLKVILQSKYVGKQFIDNTSSDRRILERYFVNDLSINYSFKTRLFREISLSLQVNNLFNAQYESNAWIYRYVSGGEEHFMDGYFPQAGIHLFGGIALRL